MNLPAYIITCQLSSMNLPAHGTASPDPSKASLSVKTTHTTHNLPCKRLAHPPVPLGETGSGRLAIFVPPPGAMFSYRSSLSRVRLADLVSPPGASLCRLPFWVFDRLAHPVQPPGAVTIPYQSLIFTSLSIIPHFLNLSQGSKITLVNPTLVLDS